MKILLIAPHPFYQERGTPIAVDMLLRVLSDLGHYVDVFTFPEGEDRLYDNTKLYRVRGIGKVKGIRPGFSLKKIYLDLFLLFAVNKACKKNGYDVVHAIEEAGFMAAFLKYRFRIPYIYDMDSLLSAQLTDSRPWLKGARSLFEFFENRIIKKADAVAPMCQDLADEAAQAGASTIVVLKDVSLLKRGDDDIRAKDEELKVLYEVQGLALMYIGNLEPYQGIDMLLGSFVTVQKSAPETHLFIIGGNEKHLKAYRQKIDQLGSQFNIKLNIHLLGPRPVASISYYLEQADILVSPRTQGTNTPMKIYSYMHSGIPIVATNLVTHTQALNSDFAELTHPDQESFAQGLLRLVSDEKLRFDLGKKAREQAEREHSYEGFKSSVDTLYQHFDH